MEIIPFNSWLEIESNVLNTLNFFSDLYFFRISPMTIEDLIFWFSLSSTVRNIFLSVKNIDVSSWWELIDEPRLITDLFLEDRLSNKNMS